MTDKDKDKNDDLIMVGDGVEDQQRAADRSDDDTPPDGVRADDAAEGDEDDDRRLGAGEAEDDELTESRRSERKSRNRRQKDARERDKTELRFLRSRNEVLEKRMSEFERRLSGSEVASIDSRLSQIDRAIRSADKVYADAITENKGDEAAEAMRIRDGLRDQQTQLKVFKQRREEQGDSARTVDEPSPLLVERVRSWHERNRWFDFGRSDQDSAIAGALDDSLAREGYDPTTQEYYDEFDRRIAKHLPHRARRSNGRDDDRDDDRRDDRDTSRREDRSRDNGGARRPSGPKFRVGGRERVLRSNEVHISRERREAMEEAGVWDDPKLRSRYLKRYAKWDRENANKG